jgi:hypothetical protein
VVQDWQVTVHGSREEPSREGWKKVTFDIVVENVGDRLLKLSTSPFSLSARWRDTTYDGSVSLPSHWLPPGYRAQGVIQVEVPAAAPDVSYILVKRGRRYDAAASQEAVVEPALGASYPPLPPMPTSRQDQPLIGETLEPAKDFKVTFAGLQLQDLTKDPYSWAGSMYQVNLGVQLRNDSGQDHRPRDAGLEFQFWDAQGQVRNFSMTRYGGKATLSPLSQEDGAISLGWQIKGPVQADLHLLVRGNALSGGYRIYRIPADFDVEEVIDPVSWSFPGGLSILADDALFLLQGPKVVKLELDNKRVLWEERLAGCGNKFL